MSHRPLTLPNKLNGHKKSKEERSANPGLKMVVLDEKNKKGEKRRRDHPSFHLPEAGKLPDKQFYEVKNYYEVMPKGMAEEPLWNPNEKRLQLRHYLICLLIAGTRRGKTSLCMNIVEKMDCWDKIYIFAHNTEEPLYQLVKERWKKYNVELHDNVDSMPSIEQMIQDHKICKEKKIHDQKLMIFDDQNSLTSKQKQFLQACHKEVAKLYTSIIWITQAYFTVPKDFRLQYNCIVLKHIPNPLEVKEICKRHNCDVSPEQLLKMYKIACGEPDNFSDFFLIDCGNSKLHNAKYRHNFDKVMVPPPESDDEDE